MFIFNPFSLLLLILLLILFANLSVFVFLILLLIFLPFLCFSFSVFLSHWQDPTSLSKLDP